MFLGDNGVLNGLLLSTAQPKDDPPAINAVLTQAGYTLRMQVYAAERGAERPSFQ